MQLPPVPKISYVAAPLSVWRRNKGMVCLFFECESEQVSGFIALPVPKWFRRHESVRYVPERVTTGTDNGAKGLSYTRCRAVRRGLKDYLEDVVRHKVDRLIARRRYLASLPANAN
ncbi:MAG: hypothetical protein ACK4S4_15770 [Pyrinomonadaceae bacterium]